MTREAGEDRGSGEARDDGREESERPAADGALLRDGLSWSWELDLAALLAAVNEPAPWGRSSSPAARSTIPADTDSDSAPPLPTAEAELAEYLEAVDAGRSKAVPISAAAGLVAESLPTSPDLAGWLAISPAGALDDGALAGVAASYRRLASWAQAGELAAIAELASRSAAADDRIGVDEEGRPARLPDDACGQVSLALTMSQCGASWWADLAVTLQWRLAATGAALRSGAIDLGRARAIAEATAVLDEENARAVEGRVLPGAGTKTMGQLRAALRRAVIAADPQGAERRREEAERRAKVMLYPDAEGTASLIGGSLPGVRAAAAMARISALARALKATGAGGGIDLLRAQVFLGLLLGTLPYIPPAPDGPPDAAPPDDGPSDEGPSDDGPSDGGPSDGGPSDGGPSDGGPSDDGLPGEETPVQGRVTQRSAPDCGLGDDCGHGDGSGDGGAGDGDHEGSGARLPPWPQVLPFLQPGPSAMGGLRPLGGGLLDLRLSWGTLVGESAEPGHLSRLGPITPAQAGYLGGLATCDPAVDWRVIVTGPDGRAVAVARVPRGSFGRDRQGRRAAQDSDPGLQGLIGRVTVTISRDQLDLPSTEPVFTPVLTAAFTPVLTAAFTRVLTAAFTRVLTAVSSRCWLRSPTLRELLREPDLHPGRASPSAPSVPRL